MQRPHGHLMANSPILRGFPGGLLLLPNVIFMDDDSPLLLRNHRLQILQSARLLLRDGPLQLLHTLRLLAICTDQLLLKCGLSQLLRFGLQPLGQRRNL